MKYTLIICLFLANCISNPEITQANELKLGEILDNKQDQSIKSDILVEYEYNDKGVLILTFHNIEMNAAAEGVTGIIKVTGDKILINPAEVYGKGGPVDSVRQYSIRYHLKKIKPAIYTLIHDDSVAEGQDRVAQVTLNLSKPIKSKQNIPFRETDTSNDALNKSEPEKDPFDDSE